MSKATFVPAKTAPKVVEVEVEPAKVVLELSVEDAALLRALLGRTKGDGLLSTYRQLSALSALPRKVLHRDQGPISLELA